MKIGVIGCGYVFDHYMATWARYPELILKGVADRDGARREVVAQAYKLKAYASNEELLADPEITIVVNLTSIESHVEVNRAALLAGKHVYSEKPLAPDIEQARELIALAEKLGLRLSGAPSNAMSDTTQTMWKAVRDGAVGDVRIVYAEFDDNVIYRMYPEIWRSRTGAPWPYLHEYEWGCTYEHVGYHLTWLCAIFGPVESVTAFSKQILPDKTTCRSTRQTRRTSRLHASIFAVASSLASLAASARHTIIACVSLAMPECSPPTLIATTNVRSIWSGSVS